MTLYNSSQFIMNKIIFNDMGVAIEDYNMNGYNIVGTSLTWKPFMANDNCDKTGRNCQNYGLVADLIDIWGKTYNFTWDIYADVNNDWGMWPLEGTPYNTSGKWKGVMGDIVEGKYQLTINAWIALPYRTVILDFVPFTADRTILCLIPKLPDVDPGLFIRPFTNDAWIGVAMITFGSLTVLFVPYFFIDRWDDMKSNHIILTALWVMYFLLEGFYGGALTMFFVDEITIPFNSFRDVLQAYPEWNIVFLDGLEVYIKPSADQVSLLYLYIGRYIVKLKIKLFAS